MFPNKLPGSVQLERGDTKPKGCTEAPKGGSINFTLDAFGNSVRFGTDDPSGDKVGWVCKASLKRRLNRARRNTVTLEWMIG